MKIVNLRDRAFAFPKLLNLPKFLNLLKFLKLSKLPNYISAKNAVNGMYIPVLPIDGTLS